MPIGVHTHDVVEAPQETEQVEAVAVMSIDMPSHDATVEVAEIEADARVEIAAIEAATHVAAIEAQAEIAVAQVESVEEWRTNYAMLEATLSEERAARVALEAQIASLTETATAQAAAIALLTPPPPSEAEPGPEDQPPESQDGQREAEPATGRATRRRVWM